MANWLPFSPVKGGKAAESCPQEPQKKMKEQIKQPRAAMRWTRTLLGLHSNPNRSTLRLDAIFPFFFVCEITNREPQIFFSAHGLLLQPPTRPPQHFGRHEWERRTLGPTAPIIEMDSTRCKGDVHRKCLGATWPHELATLSATATLHIGAGHEPNSTPV